MELLMLYSVGVVCNEHRISDARQVTRHVIMSTSGSSV